MQATPTPGLVFWLPPAEAARRFGVSRADLTREVRAGRLKMRAKVAGGELVATLSSAELVAVFGPPDPAARPAASEPAGAARADAGGAGDAGDAGDAGELVAAREAVRLLELDRARLEGQLETAGRVERGLQRYADKLEQRLEQAEVLRLNLARAVGQLEAEAARLRGRLAAQPTLIEAPKAGPRRRKRGWFRR